MLQMVWLLKDRRLLKTEIKVGRLIGEDGYVTVVVG